MKIFDDYGLAKKLHYNYLNAKPFPNIIIDNFIDSEVAMRCYQELKNHNIWITEDQNNSFMMDNQVNKWFTPWDQESLACLQQQSPTVFEVFSYFNSDKFIEFLTELTGIQNLLPDPVFWGGGIHKIKNGGKLNLHVDYNINPYTRKFRVLNLLLYLNPIWDDNWNGHLELWNYNEKKMEYKIAPLLNRAVIFNLSDISVHGHPVPLQCPEDIERYSFALYYFIEEPNQEYYERTSVRWHNEFQSH